MEGVGSIPAADAASIPTDGHGAAVVGERPPVGWRTGWFRVHDPDPTDIHSALYLVCPNGLMVNLSSDPHPTRDAERAQWMADTLNAALEKWEECEACGGNGDIVEEARITGPNQHSACKYACDDCEGTGRVPAASDDAEQAGYGRGLTDARHGDLVEAADVLRELFCGDTVHMALAGNPAACARMEQRIAGAVAKASPVIGPARTSLETGSLGTPEGVKPKQSDRNAGRSETQSGSSNEEVRG